MATQIEVQAGTGNRVSVTVKDVVESSGDTRRSLLQVSVEVSFVVEGASPRQTEQTLTRMQESGGELAGASIESQQIENVEELDDGGGDDGAAVHAVHVLIQLLVLPLLVLLVAMF